MDEEVIAYEEEEEEEQDVQASKRFKSGGFGGSAEAVELRDGEEQGEVDSGEDLVAAAAGVMADLPLIENPFA